MFSKMCLCSFQSHRRVSLNLHDKFDSWHSKWQKDNVTPEMASETDQWLMGEGEDIKPSKTHKEPKKNPAKAPYYEYYKYWTEYPEQPKVPGVPPVVSGLPNLSSSQSTLSRGSSPATVTSSISGPSITPPPTTTPAS